MAEASPVNIRLEELEIDSNGNLIVKNPEAARQVKESLRKAQGGPATQAALGNILCHCNFAIC